MYDSALQAIRQAIRDRMYLVSRHVWENYVEDNERPQPSLIADRLVDNVPEVLEPYPTDERGASCLIVMDDGQGGWLHTVIGYNSLPVRIITA